MRKVNFYRPGVGGGGGGEGIFWRGRGYMVFMGNGGDISRRQQSIKEGGQSKKGGGGGS